MKRKSSSTCLFLSIIKSFSFNLIAGINNSNTTPIQTTNSPTANNGLTKITTARLTTVNKDVVYPKNGKLSAYFRLALLLMEIHSIGDFVKGKIINLIQ